MPKTKKTTASKRTEKNKELTKALNMLNKWETKAKNLMSDNHELMDIIRSIVEADKDLLQGTKNRKVKKLLKDQISTISHIMVDVLGRQMKRDLMEETNEK